MTNQISPTVRLGLPLATSALGALQPLVLVFAFQLGATRLVNGHNPINFCNGLLFGSLFSLAALLGFQRVRKNRDQLSDFWNWRDAKRVLMPVICGALLDAGILIALSRIEAVRVALVLTMTSVVLMVLESAEKRRWPSRLAGVGLAFVVIASGFINANVPAENASDSMVPMGVALLANNDIATSLLLLLLLFLNVLYYRNSAPLSEELGDLGFGIWQTFLQSLIFFAWATTTFGLTHLYDLRSPVLWQVMLVYGAILSTVYTLLESASLAKAGALLVSLFEGLLPFLSALFGWLLLKQPFTSQLVGGTMLVAIGIACIELAESKAEKSVGNANAHSAE